MLAATSNAPALRDVLGDIGPLDPADVTPIRLDRYLRDGDGSIYWGLATILPGFRQFRFPAKLFTFTSLGFAALAGLGWDRLRRGRLRGITALAASLGTVSVVLLAGILIRRSAILAAFRSAKGGSTLFGPFDPDGAYVALLGGLLQGSIVLGVVLLVIRLVPRRPLLAGGLALVASTADLAFANARYVLTVPQATFESPPELVRVLEEAERRDPSPGPFRVHRMPSWDPPAWQATPSSDRVRELVAWERDTIQPKYGINFGIEYTHTMGVAELYNYEWFFGGFLRTIRSPEMARALNIEVGKEVVYFPRRSFDLWNTRYFIVPIFPNGWRDEFRGYAAFLDQTKQIYPTPAQFQGSEGAARLKAWTEAKDLQIRRNLQSFPRAWVVHSARDLPPLNGLTRESQLQAMQEITYSEDLLWHDSTLTAFDPLRLAWVERDQVSELARYLRGGSPRSSETVKVTYPNPQRAELEVTLESPGLVILADVYYPGWELTIDDQPAPIYRVNRLMRGAAMAKGEHRLVYSYRPRSFQIGRFLSLAGFAVLILLSMVCVRRPIDRTVGEWSQPSSLETLLP
jgi:hypothetical protein